MCSDFKKVKKYIYRALIVCFVLSMLFPFVVSGLGFDDYMGSFILTYVPMLVGGMTTLLYPIVNSSQILGLLFWLLFSLMYLSPIIGMILARKHRWWIILPSVLLIADLVFCVRGKTPLGIILDTAVLGLTALHLYISLISENNQEV